MINADELKYWVGFSRVPGIGRIRFSQLRGHFDNLQDAWHASEGKLKQAGLDARSVDSLLALRPEISLDREIEELERHQVKALTCEDSSYPARLKETYDYPPVLYVKGELPPEDAPCLAVVGTRRPSPYGRQAAEEIVSDLSRNDILITSGLARGIDTVAHRTTLNNGGKTIAVFGCGLDVIYPAENARLAQTITEHGLLVSEHPLGTKPRPEYFPLRNRIMSGLSLGVLVIEARERSGALITASQALSQNREVFAVPGSIFSPNSKGTNHLIQAGGAKLVADYADILEELNLITSLPRQAEIREFVPANESETAVLKQLTSEPVQADEICRLSGLPIAEVSSTLAILELNGIVRHVGNMSYVLDYRVRTG
ncbi:MAG: DNA-processing protein DprA [Dehalococcoidia bacterium]|nr:DNA-processing protein DprA [Dehalococcoidia bacterium]